jgi:hypothetical protein
LGKAMGELRQGPGRWGKVYASEFFHSVALLLSSSLLDPRDDRQSFGEGHYLFLCRRLRMECFPQHCQRSGPWRDQTRIYPSSEGHPNEERHQRA